MGSPDSYIFWNKFNSLILKAKMFANAGNINNW